MRETQQSTKVDRHIQHLQEMHDELDIAIRKYYDEYGDDISVTRMKKKKLKLKEEIEKYKNKL
jgi:hypothetical protein